ncbi:MAG: DEAD/DEAH box helicase, partial [Candidatus Saccharibacteria bacterium]
MNLKDAVEQLENDYSFRQGVVFKHYIPSVEGEYKDFPADCDPALISVLKGKGIDKLYSHQSRAYELGASRCSFVVVTPTASGKTLCYNLPILDAILKNPDTRSLYIFPTKALAQDQLAELHETLTMLEKGIKAFTYDGDTPVDARRSVRHAANLVITNPDMLHTGILPHHTKWISLFENLQYVVLDEIHSYRGVFGSHMAHVIHRLKRVARYYGSDPVFIASSATIANPEELAEKLVGQPFVGIRESGAPRGGKYFIFYNPPVINEDLGIRRSSLNESRRIASHFLDRGLKTIAFARSRLKVEVLGKYLRDKESTRARPRVIKTYRGGYLPNERRAIEQGLREGKIDGVVSTNAMELGVDIGELDVCVMAGYAGSIASTWQQAGRAGRRSKASAAVLVASSAPVDQYLVRHPQYFLEQTPEMGLINPDNVIIKAEHLKCAC